MYKVDPYLKAPVHPITVLLVGAGATGSLLLTKLARISIALTNLYGYSLFVIVADDDVVMPHNLGKQLFMPDEIGLPKATALVTRLNRFFGFGWKSEKMRIKKGEVLNCNIIISCTDNVESRQYINDSFYKPSKVYEAYQKSMYWIDCGNARDTGNVILSDKKKVLPGLFTLHPDLKDHEQPEEPSCSLAESLERQNLFVNDWAADTAAVLLWDLLTKTEMDWYGAYFNIATMKMKRLEYEADKIQALKSRRRNDHSKKQQKDKRSTGNTASRRVQRTN